MQVSIRKNLVKSSFGLGQVPLSTNLGSYQLLSIKIVFSILNLHQIDTSHDCKYNFFFEVYEKKWFFPPVPVLDWPRKNSFLGSGPGITSFRLSHQWLRSVEKWRTSSVYGRTDGRTEKCRQKLYFHIFWKYAKKSMFVH